MLKMAGIDGELIVTVHKLGYKFVPPKDEPTDDQSQQSIKKLKHLLLLSSVLLLVTLGYIVFDAFAPSSSVKPSSQTVALKAKQNNAHTQIYILRHTEKVDNSEDPNLSEAGERRAAYWKKVLKYVDLDQIFTTDFKRNRQTASIIAKDDDVTTELYYPMSFEVVKFIQQVEGKKVLIIGHSNTIPDMANRLLGESKYPPMSHQDYNQLTLITITPTGEVSSSLLHIEMPVTE